MSDLHVELFIELKMSEKRLTLLEKDVVDIKKQMKLMTEALFEKDREITQLKEELAKSSRIDRGSTVLGDEDLKEMRRELEKLRTNLIPGLPVKFAKPV